MNLITALNLWNNIRRISWVFVFFIVVITTTEFKIIHYVHKDNISSFSGLAVSITEGQSGWRVNQNRLLGPYMTTTIMRGTGWNARRSYIFLTVALLFLVNFLSYYLFKSLYNGNKNYGLLYCAVFAALFVAILDDQFLYIFDYLDALVGLLFAYGVVRHKSISYFIPIFFVGIFNREQALFIPLWLILCSIKIVKRKILLNRTWLLSGSLLMSFGVLYTKIARDFFYVGGQYWMGTDESHKEVGNFVIPFENLLNLFQQIQVFFTFNDSIPQWVLVLIFALPLYMIYYHKSYFRKNPAIAILMLAQGAAILTFAVIFETRTFTCLIPFVTMIDCSSRFQREL